jgi:GNAT superfamily N-acetyltransferase
MGSSAPLAPLEHAPRPAPGPGIDIRLAAAVKALVRAQPVGVTLRASFDEGWIMLDLIKVDPELRGRGHAGHAVKALLKLADSVGLPVRLHAIALPGEGRGPDLEALLRWYESLGFVDHGERSASGLVTMERSPGHKHPCAGRAVRLCETHRHLAGLSGRSPQRQSGRTFRLPKHR